MPRTARNRVSKPHTAARAPAISSPNGAISQHRRELIADFCKLVGSRLATHQPARGKPNRNAAMPKLSPRMRQTLEHLLAGDSEKQIAHRLALSQHTVHVYVKSLYRGFGVSSRGELLALFVSHGASAAAAPTSGDKVPLARLVVCL